MYDVVILAGGKGTRLRPFSFERPKTLCPVCNVSVLGHLLKQLQLSGISASKLNLGDPEAHELAVAEAPQDFDLNMVQPRGSFKGTASLVSQLFSSETDTTLVIYGDSLLWVDFSDLIQFHQRVREKGGLATILYHRPSDLHIPEKDGRTYHGVMSVNSDGFVTCFEEKPRVEDIKPGFDLANAAVFIIERDLLQHPDIRGARDFSRNVFEPAVEKKLPIYGCSIKQGFRYDIGSPSRLFDANVAVLRGKLPGYIPGREIRPGIRVTETTHCDSTDGLIPHVLLGNQVYVGQNSQIGPDVIIGNGCEIEEGAVISHAVIMNNSHIGAYAKISKSIIGPGCKIDHGQKVPPYTVLGPCSILGGSDWPNWA